MVQKCDTSKQAKQNEDTETWCRRCWRGFIRSDENAPVTACHTCGTFHLKDFMAEKIPGWFCRHCAKKYDADLLAKMTEVKRWSSPS